MMEQARPKKRQETRLARGNFEPVFGQTGGSDRTVTVSHGPYLERLPVANLSVADIRARFADRLDIDPQAQAVIDGREVGGEDTIVTAGQVLTFVRKAGEKGRTGDRI